MNDTFKFWLVFSVGVASGAAIALLSASQSGEKTRKQIGRKLDNATDYVKDQVDGASGYIKEQASTIGDQASKAYQRGKESTSAASGNLNETLQSAAKTAKSAVS